MHCTQAEWLIHISSSCLCLVPLVFMSFFPGSRHAGEPARQLCLYSRQQWPRLLLMC
jgi:hypothetical protein